MTFIQNQSNPYKSITYNVSESVHSNAESVFWTENVNNPLQSLDAFEVDCYI
jgi:hypothetical protein